MQILESMCRLINEQESLLWDSVEAFLDSGSSPDELAAAVGMSRPTLYRRLQAHRDAHGDTR